MVFSKKFFGTDGVRGSANEYITVELAMSLGQAAAAILGCNVAQELRPIAVLGKDPRNSSDFISAALIAGLNSEGVDVYDVGVLPTPAVAFFTQKYRASFGIMVSASHNLAVDNGIKFFAKGGKKLSYMDEEAIEAQMLLAKKRPKGDLIGRTFVVENVEDSYISYLINLVGNTSFVGIKIVLDCAHGSASNIAPEVFRKLGAEVVVIGADPDGMNINLQVGSTDLALLRSTVVSVGADLGIAYDGDADRCLAVDHLGDVVDGDQIMGILALALQASGELAADTLVATVMSNLGLKLAMKDKGIQIVDTPVGDRHVLEAMDEGGYSLGGEQSGHIIIGSYATTGDGVLTSLKLVEQVAKEKISLADLSIVVKRLPQVLLNVSDVTRGRIADSDVVEEVECIERELGESGRVLLRPSGTEPVIRIMVEAATEEQATIMAKRLEAIIVGK